MSVVIIGGHERMEAHYREICKKYNCRAKIFTKMPVNLKEQIGNADLMILFTSTASHKMVNCAVSESERNNIAITRSHSSSASALKGILEQYS
ncbi:MAG: DUF2325 domain-containing protein [Sedimentibacter sp.]|uniref:DUF2325 domain-containing protein n=1 Tax=Sedimentibacter sp. TaxID=1960295 RepID=UPI003158B26E